MSVLLASVTDLSLSKMRCSGIIKYSNAFGCSVPSVKLPCVIVTSSFSNYVYYLTSILFLAPIKNYKINETYSIEVKTLIDFTNLKVIITHKHISFCYDATIEMTCT